MNNLRRLNSCVTNMLVSYNGVKLNRTVSLNICRHFFSRGVGEDAKTNRQKSFEREPILHLIKKWKLNISLAENYPVFKPGPELKAAAQKYFNQLWKTKSRTISLTDLSELPKTTSPEVLCLGLYLPLKVRLKLREIMKTVGQTKGQRDRDYQYYDLKEGKFENPFEHTKLEKDEIFASRFRVDDTLMVTWLKKYPLETDIEEYKKHFESFVKGRKTLCRAIVTICGQRGMTDITTADLEILESAQVPYALVITALEGKEIFLIKTLVSVVEYIKNNPSEYCFPDPFFVQPVKNIGLDRIHSFIIQEAGLIK